jgi:hypothetical protein
MSKASRLKGHRLVAIFQLLAHQANLVALFSLSGRGVAVRGVVLLSNLFLLWDALTAFAANPSGRPVVTPAENFAVNVSYTLHDLVDAYILGETRGIIAGVIFTAGLVYFSQRWFCKQRPRPPNLDKPPGPA